MITPHLPPEQAANALLPVMLANAFTGKGIDTRFVSHPARHGSPRPMTHRVDFVPRRARDAFSRSTLGAVVTGARMALGAMRAVRASDIVHLHGNGFIVEVGQVLARRFGKPYVVTLYGTDVWDHNPAAHHRFGRAVREAQVRVFYSRGLLDFARPLNLAPDPSVVIYAPVGASFEPIDPEKRHALRRELGVGDEPLLVTVKRLHFVAGYETWLAALPDVFRRFPDAKIWLIGEGELRPVLEARVRELGLTSQVRFLGQMDHEAVSRYYAAADVFVLPSEVESWGTVMLEALASGTPVVTTDTPGGLEVRDHFPDDVTVVRKGEPAALADAVSRAIAARRRVSPGAQDTLREQFGVDRCAESYLSIYRQALGASIAS